MAKTIVWDLEGVLINSVYNTIYHPQAREVIIKSQRDFDFTYLWTRASIELAYCTLLGMDYVQYFDKLIGASEEKLKSIIWCIDNGHVTEKTDLLNEDRIKKDLSRLGNPEDFVIIEDIMRLRETVRRTQLNLPNSFIEALPEMIKSGYPPERAIHIETFTGQTNHSLIDPYNQALSKFTPSSNQT